MQTSGRFVLTAEDGVSAGVPWGPRAVLYHRGPQPPGDPVPVCGLLGTGPHSGRGAARERVKLHLPLPTAPHRLRYRLSHPISPLPRPWKNCLPRNRSLVPERLVTAALSP